MFSYFVLNDIYFIQIYCVSCKFLPSIIQFRYNRHSSMFADNPSNKIEEKILLHMTKSVDQRLLTVCCYTALTGKI